MLALEFASYPNSFQTTPPPPAVKSGYVKGETDTALIPFIGYFYNINEKFKFGTGIFGIGGTGYDYKDTYGVKGTYAALSVPLAVSYSVSEAFNLGASLNFVLTQLKSNNAGYTKDKTAGSATIAPSVGASYALTRTLLLGVDLALGTTATFKDFYYESAASSGHDLKIGTPLQFALGIGHNTEKYSVGFKYRLVNWKNTENYKQLDWVDQHTFSVGGQYKVTDPLTLRAGVYYVTSVYNKTSGVNGAEEVEFNGTKLSKYLRDFSNAMMYGIPQWQYALGAGYKLAQMSMLDFGMIYEPEASISFKGTTPLGAYEIQKKNSNLQIFLAYSHQV
jgi:long-chain fatty acid transport protein